MITIKLGVLFDLEPAFIRLVRTVGPTALPIKVAYLLRKQLKTVGTTLATFVEQRNELVRKYGVEKDGSIGVAPNTAGWVDFKRAYDELCSIETAVDIEPIKVSDLMVDGVSISSDDLFLLEPILAD